MLLIYLFVFKLFCTVTVIIFLRIYRSMPKLYLPLLRAQLIKLDKAFQPGLSTITWTSLEIPSYCAHIETVLNEVDLFVKEVDNKFDNEVEFSRYE